MSLPGHNEDKLWQFGRLRFRTQSNKGVAMTATELADLLLGITRSRETNSFEERKSTELSVGSHCDVHISMRNAGLESCEVMDEAI